MSQNTERPELSLPSRQKRDPKQLKDFTAVEAVDPRTGQPSFVCLKCVGKGEEQEQEQQDEHSPTRNPEIERRLKHLRKQVAALRGEDTSLQSDHQPPRQEEEDVGDDSTEAAVQDLIAQQLTAQLLWKANSLISSLRLFKLLDTEKVKQSDEQTKKELKETFLFINDEGKEFRAKFVQSLIDGLVDLTVSQPLKNSFKEFEELFRDFEKETGDQMKWFDLLN